MAGSGAGSAKRETKMDRRRFLGAGAGLTAGLAGLGPAAVAAAADPPRIRRYVTLGRTGLEVSDISFGSSRSSDPRLVRHAAERGVTCFDTAESYRGGGAEEAIGEALQGRREHFVITSKHKAWSGETRASMAAALDGSLRRLRTDYVDIYFNHAVNDVRRLQNPEWREFTDRAVRDGKIRFRGVSGHGSALVECLDYALDHDLADVILAAYNFAEDASFFEKMRARFHFVAPQTGLTRVLERASAKGVGVVVMKTLMGARLNDMRPWETGGATFSQAAFRWVLSRPHVDGLVVSMTDAASIDEYVAGSGAGPLGAGELGLLGRYAELQGPRYCRPGCGACAESCPAGVEVSEVLRTRMYEVDYRDSALARADYAGLGAGAAACLACDGAPCLRACPAGIPVAAFTRDAALRLARGAPARS